jgi:hypothetical protein
MTTAGRYAPATAPLLTPTPRQRIRARLGSPGVTLALAGAGFYLLVVRFLYRSILGLTGGRFMYPLDDPYIHLALAEQLAHGHYGINAAEFSSPSSSILWPLLLVPGAGTHLHAYLPLAWNLLFGSIAALLLGWQVARWPPQVDEQGRMAWWKQAVTVMLLVFTANLAGLTMVGMEHVLQVLISICCAIGMVEALSGKAIPNWCLAAAIVAPAVRYEDLTLTLAISMALVGLGKWKKATAVFALSLIPLAAFSAYLKARGLPLLPMSVLVKGNAFAHSSLAVKIFSRLSSNIHDDLINPERYPLGVLFLLFAGLAWQAETRVRRFVFGGAAALGGLQLLIGRFGWFYRYEVYALIFLTLICLRVLAERPRFLFGYFSLGLVFCASSYIKAAADTSTAALEVYEQQYQMHRFVTEFYSGSYAVNDLGWTSYQRRPGAYVLDLYGLASVEASTQVDKPAAWLAGIVKRYDVPLAMIYPEWFHVPPAWNALAKMCLPREPISNAHQCVVFYSTTPATDDEIRAALQRFSPTLPKDVLFHLSHGRNDDAMWTPHSR